MGLRMAEPCLGMAISAAPERHWYAVQVTPRHEKKVTTGLGEKQLPTFLPVVPELHHWSDRQQRVEIPLFAGYTFVRLSAEVEERVAVLRTPGVVRLVGHGFTGTPIPDKQIEDISLLVNSRLRLEPYPFLNVGDRVRVRNGALVGVEGILIGKSADATLIVSIDLLQRSLAARIHGFDVERVGRASSTMPAAARAA